MSKNSLPWPPMPPTRPDQDYYVLDRTAMENLMRVKTALYRHAAERLSGDDVRDLANIMELNLSNAIPTTETKLRSGIK